MFIRRRFAVALVAVYVAAVGVWSGCRKETKSTAGIAPHAPTAKSGDCRACHEAIFKTWSGSDHALAHRAVDATRDADAFSASHALTAAGIDYRIGWEKSAPAFSEQRGPAPAESFTAEFALGHSPLRQYIVPVGGGRYQAAELAFDPTKKEWFNVFGEERRQPGEWGHWRGRGMNWNSMCAQCHLTGFRKNYDTATDTYASTWSEHGVGCAQCHGALPGDHGTTTATKMPADRKRAQETCAPCHARNEPLTGELSAGANYADHFRLTLPVDPAVFYPDGQMREEDFNVTSFLGSRMGGKAGVTCLDCHDPHSGAPRMPVENNALCLQCHGPTPRAGAPSIDPSAHSHHRADSTGNRCVSCHMPTTTFMQRDSRHDHGFLKPDPLLTQELAIPNACNRCHADRPTDWAMAATDAWYGEKMNSRQRERARAVASAQASTPEAAAKLLALLDTEEISTWRATLLTLMQPYAARNAKVVAAARSALHASEPLERAAAVQVLAAMPAELPALRPLLNDPTRLVRLDAAWALSPELAPGSAARKELDAYLANGADQPIGRLRLAQDLFNRGRVAEAEAPLRLATQWDPNSAPIHATLGTVLNALGRFSEAGAEFWRAAQLAPTVAGDAFNAALAFAAAGKPADAELALRETVRRDPRHDRAWYNLGLLLAQTARAEEAIASLQRAERLAPHNADYPYARATILWQRGDRAGAMAAARRALEIDPTHTGASAILR